MFGLPWLVTVAVGLLGGRGGWGEKGLGGTHTHTAPTCCSGHQSQHQLDTSFAMLCVCVQVRANGEDVADSRSITVDSTPPLTRMQASLPLPGTTSTESITFTFSG